MPRAVSRTIISSAILLLIHCGGWVAAADLPEIRRRGVLQVAARPVSTLIYSPGNSEFPGFCYELAEEFSKALDVDMTVNPVDSFRSYWQHGGDQERLALFHEVDLYAEILTITESRQELLSMTPYVENTEILVGRFGSTVTDLRDLRGLRVAVVEGMSFQPVLEQVLSQQGVPFTRVPAVLRDGRIVPRDRRDARGARDEQQRVQLLLLPPGTRTTLMLFPEQLALGTIDVFVLDSFSLFHQLHASQALRSMVRPLFPVSERIGRLGFGTSTHTPELNEMLSSWMEEFRTSAAYESLVRRYLGISYDRYLAFIEDFPE
jgi:ABC-type amino acid transport substrate-binding protein